MLRRTQTIAAKDEASPAGEEQRKSPDASADGSTSEAPQTGPFGVDRRIDPRLKFDAPAPDANPSPKADERRVHERITLETSNSENERRQSERKRLDALRAEFLRNKAAQPKQSNVSSFLQKLPFGLKMKPSRIILLLIAVSTGGLAAFMAARLDEQTVAPITPPATEVVQEARTKILVAKEPIGIGQRLSPTSVAWEDWPEGSVRSDYVTLEAVPEAIADMTGAVARFEIFPGEPIREQKLALAEQGYLSAVLASGMRSVSVSISPESASGGFIVPNDHVDVIVTRTSAINPVSETILQNVRVLAINARLGELGKSGEVEDLDNPSAQLFTDQAIATLELDPQQAEVITSAAAGGNLSLMLRSMVDFAKSDNNEQSGANQAIRLSSPFWNQTDDSSRPR